MATLAALFPAEVSVSQPPDIIIPPNRWGTNGTKITVVSRHVVLSLCFHASELIILYLNFNVVAFLFNFTTDIYLDPRYQVECCRMSPRRIRSKLR